MTEVLFPVVTVVGTAVVAVLTAIGTKYRRENARLKAEIETKVIEAKRAKDLGDKLLVAHEDLVRDGLSDDKVVAAVKKDPSLVSTAVLRTVLQEDPFHERIQDAVKEHRDLARFVDVDSLLRERGVLHVWKVAGTRQVKITKGRTSSRYTLVTELCQRCRVEHQYFRDGGHEDIANMEGFFIGGKRLKIDRLPHCLLPEPNKE